MPSEFVERLRKGRPEAYREAVRLHGDLIYGFLLRLTGRSDVADDLFQETWIALARSAVDLAPDTHLERWLLTVARNAWRSHRRWAWVDVSRWAVEEVQADMACEGPSPEDELEASRTARELDRALGSLRDKDREVLLLCGMEGLDTAEVASMLGLSSEALRQRLSRARKALADELDRRQKRGAHR
jgi:RNA polymerase sigma factor (sigma-70 family)